MPLHADGNGAFMYSLCVVGGVLHLQLNPVGRTHPSTQNSLCDVTGSRKKPLVAERRTTRSPIPCLASEIWTRSWQISNLKMEKRGWNMILKVYEVMKSNAWSVTRSSVLPYGAAAQLDLRCSRTSRQYCHIVTRRTPQQSNKPSLNLTTSTWGVWLRSDANNSMFVPVVLLRSSCLCLLLLKKKTCAHVPDLLSWLEKH